MRVTLGLLGAATLSLASAAHAQTAQTDLRFAHIFADHGVLQRGQPIAVWGRAAPGQRVAVSLAGHSASARADRSGMWRAALPAMPAGGGYVLTATAGAERAEVRDVKLGDVYLCSGQSNMEFPARLATGAWGNYPDAGDDDLRFVTIAQRSEALPQDDLSAETKWVIAAPDTVGQASAVCYFMARSLRKSEKVPIGMVHASWGGTTIQSWISAPTLGAMPGYADDVRTVALLGSDPAAGLAREERRQDAWWRAQGLTTDDQRGWSAADLDDGGWRTLAKDASLRDATGATAAAPLGKVTWLRTSVMLTDADAAGAARLKLGPIDTYDSVWVNGRWVGNGTVAWYWRDYALPAGTLHAGRNTIALRVMRAPGADGVSERPEQRGVQTAGGRFVALDGGWRYKAGVAARDAHAPASPWAVPTSLTTLYNGMIAPLRGYGFTLAAWYQGEANAGEPATYRALLAGLFADWRRQLDAPRLPFLVAQLTSFGSVASAPGQSNWAELRQAEADAVASDPHAALAVTIDVGDRYDIHPTQKMIVGERLARGARAVAYGGKAPVGPTAASVTRSGGDLVVRYAGVTGGLRTYSAAQAIGFEACAGATCRYVPGEARGDTVVLAGAAQPGVTSVRYAWADAPYVNLYDGADLPAAPFTLPVSEVVR